MKTAFSAFPRFDIIPECDGQPDGGRICRSTLKASFAARCKNCHHYSMIKVNSGHTTIIIMNVLVSK